MADFINVRDDDKLKEIFAETQNAVQELLAAHPVRKGELFVIGCSSSEIAGGILGKNSSEEIGKTVYEAASEICTKNGLFLAAQCCEHLNRALVIEEKVAEKFGYEEVSVVPWLKGGGSFATAAYYGMENPVVVEHIKASAGLDIGGVMIGMHLKDVAVPVRLVHNRIGKAWVSSAFCRPKLIGGERARYLQGSR